MNYGKVSRINDSLISEIERTKKQLEDLGIFNVTNMEAQTLIAEKNKRAKMPTSEVRSLFSQLRGLR